MELSDENLKAQYKNIFQQRDELARSKGDPFVYRTLETPDTIRLATLSYEVKKDRLVIGDILAERTRLELHVTLQHVSLAQAPEYTALSYVWGDPAKTKPIFIDGKEMQVTENLKNFIVAAVSRESTREQLLWIDAICINQQDIQEKSQQVRRMTEIYNKASRVHVWLHTDGDAEKGIAAIKTIKAWAKWLEDNDLTKNQLLHTIRDTEETRALLLNEYERQGGIEPWLQAEDFLNHVWWSRMWCVQESTAHRRVLFLYSDSWFDIYDLRRAAAAFRFFYELGKVPNNLGRGFGNVDANALLWRTRHEGGYYARLLDLLRSARYYDCSDPKDKIYAVVGFATDVHLDKIPIDYTMSVTNLYIEMGHYFLEEYKNLDWLESVPSRMEGLPSWVPDWTNSHMPSNILVNVNLLEFAPTEGRLFYRAAGNHTRVCGENGALAAPGFIKGLQLHLRGMFIDKIASLSEVHGGARHKDRGALSSFKLLKNAAAMYEPTGQTREEAFQRTLSGDTVILTTSDSHGRAGSTARHPDISKYIPIDFTGSEASYIELVEFEAGVLANLQKNQVTPFVQGRRFVVTNRGYIGLAPPAAEAGDSIIVLFGGELTYCIRPSKEEPDCHMYVGEAYLHGFMDGEACELSHTNGIEDIILV